LSIPPLKKTAPLGAVQVPQKETNEEIGDGLPTNRTLLTVTVDGHRSLGKVQYFVISQFFLDFLYLLVK